LNEPLSGGPTGFSWEGKGKYVTPIQKKADVLTQGLDFDDMGDTTKGKIDLRSGGKF
jgi:hypothetical protein